MEVVAEMQKLRDELDKRGIKWFDKSDDWGKKMRQLVPEETPKFDNVVALWECEWMVRTHFLFKGHSVSCINGFGSYGGMNIALNDDGEYFNYGLIEMMISGNDPVGYLTCEEVFSLLDNLEEVG